VTYNEGNTPKGCDVKGGHLRVTFIVSEKINSLTNRPCFVPCAVNVVDRDGVFELACWESLDVDPFFIGKEI
jgi:hypothetical protein